MQIQFRIYVSFEDLHRRSTLTTWGLTSGSCLKVRCARIALKCDARIICRRICIRGGETVRWARRTCGDVKLHIFLSTGVQVHSGHLAVRSRPGADELRRPPVERWPRQDSTAHSPRKSFTTRSSGCRSPSSKSQWSTGRSGSWRSCTSEHRRPRRTRAGITSDWSFRLCPVSPVRPSNTFYPLVAGLWTRITGQPPYPPHRLPHVPMANASLLWLAPVWLCNVAVFSDDLPFEAGGSRGEKSAFQDGVRWQQAAVGRPAAEPRQLGRALAGLAGPSLLQLRPAPPDGGCCSRAYAAARRPPCSTYSPNSPNFLLKHTPSIQAATSPSQVECWLWPTFDMYLDDRAAATAIMTDRELQFNKEVLHSETSLCHKAFVLGGGNAGKNGETFELGTKPNLMNNGL